MVTIQMYIEKFGRVVAINDDHPLAVAQRVKDRAGAADNPDAPAIGTPAAGDALNALSFAELRARAKAAGVNTFGMGAEAIRAALRAAA